MSLLRKGLKSEGPEAEVVDSTKSLPQRQEAGTIGSKLQMIIPSIMFPSPTGWKELRLRVDSSESFGGD